MERQPLHRIGKTWPHFSLAEPIPVPSRWNCHAKGFRQRAPDWKPQQRRNRFPISVAVTVDSHQSPIDWMTMAMVFFRQLFILELFPLLRPVGFFFCCVSCLWLAVCLTGWESSRSLWKPNASHVGLIVAWSMYPCGYHERNSWISLALLHSSVHHYHLLNSRRLAFLSFFLSFFLPSFLSFLVSSSFPPCSTFITLFLDFHRYFHDYFHDYFYDCYYYFLVSFRLCYSFLLLTMGRWLNTQTSPSVSIMK